MLDCGWLFRILFEKEICRLLKQGGKDHPFNQSINNETVSVKCSLSSSISRTGCGQ